MKSQPVASTNRASHIGFQSRAGSTRTIRQSRTSQNADSEQREKSNVAGKSQTGDFAEVFPDGAHRPGNKHPTRHFRTFAAALDLESQPHSAGEYTCWDPYACALATRRASDHQIPLVPSPPSRATR